MGRFSSILFRGSLVESRSSVSPNNAGTIDGDLGTRWSNQTHGASITWDLGSAQPVAGVGLAFYNGNSRLAFFDLRTSVDGVMWETVDAGLSTGVTEQLEWRLWASTVTARYIRYVRFGNSDQSWNSITEFVPVGP